MQLHRRVSDTATPGYDDAFTNTPTVQKVKNLLDGKGRNKNVNSSAKLKCSRDLDMQPTEIWFEFNENLLSSFDDETRSLIEKTVNFKLQNGTSELTKWFRVNHKLNQNCQAKFELGRTEFTVMLHICYIFIIYSLHIHYIFIIYSLYIHYIFIIYSLHIHYIYSLKK